MAATGTQSVKVFDVPGGDTPLFTILLLHKLFKGAAASHTAPPKKWKVEQEPSKTELYLLGNRLPSTGPITALEQVTHFLGTDQRIKGKKLL